MTIPGIIIRGALIVAIIGLAGYATGLSRQVATNQSAITSLMADRDSWKAKLEAEHEAAKERANALAQAQEQIHDLQAKLQAAALASENDRGTGRSRK